MPLFISTGKPDAIPKHWTHWKVQGRGIVVPRCRHAALRRQSAADLPAVAAPQDRPRPVGLGDVGLAGGHRGRSRGLRPRALRGLQRPEDGPTRLQPPGRQVRCFRPRDGDAVSLSYWCPCFQSRLSLMFHGSAWLRRRTSTESRGFERRPISLASAWPGSSGRPTVKLCAGPW